jgi:hypothetical protein
MKAVATVGEQVSVLVTLFVLLHQTLRTEQATLENATESLLVLVIIILLFPVRPATARKTLGLFWCGGMVVVEVIDWGNGRGCGDRGRDRARNRACQDRRAQTMDLVVIDRNRSCARIFTAHTFCARLVVLNFLSGEALPVPCCGEAT